MAMRTASPWWASLIFGLGLLLILCGERLFGHLPGVRLVPAPGHTRGAQIVVVETGGRPNVIGGDMAVWFGELDEPQTEGQLRVRALDPEQVWLAHVLEPWRPAAG